MTATISSTVQPVSWVHTPTSWRSKVSLRDALNSSFAVNETTEEVDGWPAVNPLPWGTGIQAIPASCPNAFWAKCCRALFIVDWF